MTNSRFIEIIKGKGLITKEDAVALLQRYKGDAYAVLKHIIKSGTVTRQQIGEAWGDSLSVAYVDLSKTLFQSNLSKMLPEHFAREHKMVLLYKLGDAVTVACANPTQTLVIKKAEAMIGLPISTVYSFPEDIDDAIEIEYKSSGALGDVISNLSINSLLTTEGKITDAQLKQLAGDQAIVEFVRGLLLLAVKDKASDIHIEPGISTIRIRFRIDGMLHERIKLDPILHPPLISRLKILANLDIAERRRPQDGRISLQLSNKSIDFRFSCTPMIYGEKAVLRILGQSEKENVPDIADINISTPILKKLKKVVASPNGIFFITGPTGSGKTTTLYSILKYINKPDINIMTIEDPVEYRLEGLNQMQVNHKIDLTFAAALRSFLRQDPDVILIGEIRDMETARIAAQAALTGHLVLASMHTNNALQAITRLIEIGVEPFLVAPAIIGVMAQRLVRRLCDNCKERYQLSKDEIEEYFIWDGVSEVFFYKKKGCSQCNNVGYSGRIAIHELFVINNDIRNLAIKEASVLEIKDAAFRSGFHPLRYDGLKKVLTGLTTIEEIVRVTTTEEE